MIDPLQWDEADHEHPLGLNSLGLCFQVHETITPFPSFSVSELSTQDHEHIDRLARNFQTVEDDPMLIKVRSVWFKFVPSAFTRSAFWHHCPCHEDTDLVDAIKEDGFCQFAMADTTFESISQCSCVTKKLEVNPKPYSKKKPIVAE